MTAAQGIPTARVLVVEDNPVNQKVAVKILEKLGYETDVMPNGEKAIEALEQNRYDVILMDVQMPVMDGLEATRAIRSSGSKVLNPQIPIIAMTARALSLDYS